MKFINFCLIILVAIFLIVGGLFFIAKDEIQTTYELDMSCLKGYAYNYCNMTAVVTENYFNCLTDINQRTKTNELSPKLFFLDSEIHSCTIQQLNLMEVK